VRTESGPISKVRFEPNGFHQNRLLAGHIVSTACDVTQIETKFQPNTECHVTTMINGLD
jgi:hypothetical protein